MINNPSIYGTELRGYWLPLTIRRKDSIMLNNQNQNNNPSVGAAIGRVAIDMLKITVAVAGGIAVYKLAENYLSDSGCNCIGTGTGAVPALDTAGTTETAAFCCAERIESVF